VPDLFQTLQAFLQEMELPATLLPGNTIVQIPNYIGVNGRWTLFAQAVEDKQQVILYSICPITIPAAKRAPLAEFITRANYGLLIGNFEMDYNDGEVRFKTSSVAPADLIAASDLGKAVLAQLLHLNVVTMDRYLPGIMAVASTNTTPTDLIAEIETAEMLPLTTTNVPPTPDTGASSAVSYETQGAQPASTDE
jgi:hypothetical protein